MPSETLTVTKEELRLLVKELVREELSKGNYPYVSKEEQKELDDLYGSELQVPIDKKDYVEL